MPAQRLRFRVDVLEDGYPILARFRNDPQFSRASFLAALEIGVLYLYAHDDERRKLTDLLKGQMAHDFEDQVARISAHKPAQDPASFSEDRLTEPRMRKSVASPTPARVAAAPVAPEPVASELATRVVPPAPAPHRELTLSPAARGMMSAYGESFQKSEDA